MLVFYIFCMLNRMIETLNVHFVNISKRLTKIVYFNCIMEN